MDLTYQTIRSDRKTFGLTVERDRSVTVRAPRQATDEQVERFVERKRLWLYEKLRHPQKYDPVAQEPKEFVTGTSLLYLGRPYRLEIEDAPSEGVRFDGRFLVSRAVQDQAGGLLQAWYKARAREVIVPLVEELAEAMGVAYRRVLVSELRYRWGSCTPTDTLSFNWRLVKAPLPVIRYVVAHELAHLLEPNHTPRFWRLVRVQVPHFEKAKGWLRRHGQALEVPEPGIAPPETARPRRLGG